jgi:protein gp37
MHTGMKRSLLTTFFVGLAFLLNLGIDHRYVPLLFWAAMMGDRSAIEWTNATWNPVTGCTKISAGCDNCYAERFAERFRNVPGHPFEAGFDLTIRAERLEQPLRWKRSRVIFVNSMSDLFHKQVPKKYIQQVFDVMEKASWHTFQVLTKRSSKMRDFVNERYKAGDSPAHIWFGVSVEDNRALTRVRHLAQTKAAIRFLSIEPLLNSVNQLDLAGIDWVIVGGESGPHARPMKMEWAREIRDECIRSDVPLFFKQWGGLRPKSGGRELDGREWNEVPRNTKLRVSVVMSGSVV